MSILITGAEGFIGQKLTALLGQCGLSCLAITRGTFGEINGNSDWSRSLVGIKTVIHLAARVHFINDRRINLLDQYRLVNTTGTSNLAWQAASMGVERFLFLSTIKVNGEESCFAYTPYSVANPQDPYAQSKWDAEQGLKEISAQTGMELVIIRPPLVYGPQVKANFLRLLQWVDKGLPLPFASINNKRSLIFVGNLVNFIMHCIEHPQAANQTFLISDGEDLSTPDLVNRLAQQFNKKSRLFPFPPKLLEASLNLIGKKVEAQRLLGSLALDPQYAYTTLNWTPPFTVDEGLAKTVETYQTSIK